MSNIKRYVESNYKDEIRTLTEITQIPAPTFHESLRAQAVLDWLGDIGVTNTYIDEAGNVICHLGDTSQSEVSILSAHLDTVFEPNENLDVMQDATKMYAPGIGDDTANVVGLMYGIKYVVDNHITIKDHLVIAFVVGEEGIGNLKGTKHLFNTFDNVREHISFDLYIPQLITTATGSIRFKVTATTKGGHSWADFGNRNACEELASLVLDLGRIKSKNRCVITHNIGYIEGGDRINKIASSASATFEYRTCSQDNLKYAQEYLNTTIEKHTTHDCLFTYEMLGIRPANKYPTTQKCSKLKDELASIITSVTGNTPDETPASTDANVALSKGIPAANVGCVSGGMLHTSDEYIVTESLKQGLEIIINIINRYTK